VEATAAKFRRLQADKIIEPVKALHHRIEERFPCSGLGKVIGELQQVAEETVGRTRWRSSARSLPFTSRGFRTRSCWMQLTTWRI
jgi:hypothetical protein